MWIPKTCTSVTKWCSPCAGVRKARRCTITTGNAGRCGKGERAKRPHPPGLACGSTVCVLKEGSMKKRVILIADRDEVRRRGLKELLLRNGFAVIESSDKTDILRSFRQQSSLDLLIINSSLEAAGDGVEVAQQIRLWDRRVPLILLATHSSEELAIAALRTGVNDYFKQPFSWGDVVLSVRRCLANCLPLQSSTPSAPTAGATRLPT